jgi:hypothetical protein
MANPRAGSSALEIRVHNPVSLPWGKRGSFLTILMTLAQEPYPSDNIPDESFTVHQKSALELSGLCKETPSAWVGIRNSGPGFSCLALSNSRCLISSAPQAVCWPWIGSVISVMWFAI